MMSVGSRSLVALAVITSAVACHKGGTPAHPARGDALVMPRLFANVPADTPYLVAAPGPTSLALYAKLRDTFGPIVAHTIAVASAKEPNKIVDAVLAELDGKWNQAGLESLGLSAEMHFAIYGLGLSPVVLRLEIKDEKAVLATIQRIAARAGSTLPAMTARGGRSYWRADDDDGSVLISLADQQLIVALGAPAALDANLGLILGIDKPARSLGDGAVIRQIMTRHGFGPYTIGFADSRALLAAGMAEAGADPGPACRAEIDRVSGRMPRVVLGYTEVSASKIDGSMVFELAPDLVAELKATKVELPGFASAMSRPSVFAMAVGIDLAKAQGLAVAAAQAMKRLGDACSVRPLANGASAATATLSRPLPEPFGRVSGALVVVNELVLGAPGELPTALEAVAAVASPDARALWSKFGELVPLSRLLGLSTDGKLHPVGGGMLPVAFPIAGGVGASTIVVAAGAKTAPLGEQLIAARGKGSVPLYQVNYDIGWAIEMAVKTGSTQFGAKDANERAVLDAVRKLFGVVIGTIDVTDAGVSIWSSVQLK